MASVVVNSTTVNKKKNCSTPRDFTYRTATEDRSGLGAKGLIVQSQGNLNSYLATEDEAKAIAKARYEDRCIFTGLKPADGMHLFPKGKIRWRHLQNVPANIFPGVRHLHQKLDFKNQLTERKPFERAKIIREECLLEFKHLVIEQLEILWEMQEW